MSNIINEVDVQTAMSICYVCDQNVNDVNYKDVAMKRFVVSEDTACDCGGNECKDSQLRVRHLWHSRPGRGVYALTIEDAILSTHPADTDFLAVIDRYAKTLKPARTFNFMGVR